MFGISLTAAIPMSPNSRSKVEGFKVQEFKSKLEKVKSQLAIKAAHRAVEEKHGAYALRERSEPYSGNLVVKLSC